MTEQIQVKVVQLVDEGVYLVDLRSNCNVFYSVSGIRVIAPSVTVNSLDEVVAYKPLGKRILSYRNEAKGYLMDLGNYDSRLKKFGVYNSYDEDIVFSSIEEEYEYKKFIRDWKPVYSESREELVPIEFVITEVRTNSGDPDIASLWNSPKIVNDKKLYLLERNKFSIKYFKSYCEQHDLEYSIPNHSGLRFVKIKNDYIFDESFDFSKSLNFIGTLEQCKDAKKAIINGIEKKVLIYLSKNQNVKLVDAPSVLDELYTIRNISNGIYSNTKTRSLHTQLKNNINSLIQIIEDDILKNLDTSSTVHNH